MKQPSWPSMQRLDRLGAKCLEGTERLLVVLWRINLASAHLHLGVSTLLEGDITGMSPDVTSTHAV